MIELKSCPFCGSHDVDVLYFDNTGTGVELKYEGYKGKEIEGNVNPWIRCNGCGSEWFSNAEDVIEAWNRRYE